MIAGLLGRMFEVVGRVRGGSSGADLHRVGTELRRLETRVVQPVASSR